MGNKLYEESDIQAIANAIREKNGSSDKYLVSAMAAAIKAIETGGGGFPSAEEFGVPKLISGSFVLAEDTQDGTNVQIDGANQIKTFPRGGVLIFRIPHETNGKTGAAAGIRPYELVLSINVNYSIYSTTKQTIMTNSSGNNSNSYITTYVSVGNGALNMPMVLATAGTTYFYVIWGE